MIGPAEETPAVPAPMLQMPDEFNEACLGHTVDPLGPARWVYSLEKMARIWIKGHPFSDDLDYAREEVWKMVQEVAAEHGSRSPVFMDDAMRQKNEGPKIWTPGS